MVRLSLRTNQVAHQAGAYPGSVKRPGVFLLLSRWDASPLHRIASYNEWMNECLFIYRTYQIVSHGGLQFYFEWDRTSACQGASGGRYQSIFDLTHPPNPRMKFQRKEFYMVNNNFTNLISTKRAMVLSMKTNEGKGSWVNKWPKHIPFSKMAAENSNKLKLGKIKNLYQR